MRATRLSLPPCSGLLIVACALTVGMLIGGCASAPEREPRRVLFFTRNVGYYHDVVKRKGKPLSVAEEVLVELGRRMGVEVVCSKDGRVFDDSLEGFDGFAFYCNNDLTRENEAGEPPMTRAGKKRLLAAVAAGKGFMSFHSACACWRTPGERYANSTDVDPYIAMIGGEFIAHGPQQEATIRVSSPGFPGVGALAPAFRMHEEWYAVKNLARDLHVILVQETEGMRGDCYRRPPFPSTWARVHGRGRVFCTTMAHRADTWQNSTFQGIVSGGLAWILRKQEADVSPNLPGVTPQADVLRSAGATSAAPGSAMRR